MLEEQEKVMKELELVQTPLFMALSSESDIADIKIAKEYFQSVKSKDKKIQNYANTHHHMMWLDGEWQRVEQDMYGFIRDRIK